MEDYVRIQLEEIFNFCLNTNENNQNYKYFLLIFSEVYQAILNFNFEEYLLIKDLTEFLYKLYSLVRGVKNKGSLEDLKNYLLKIPNSPKKAIKLKELILITVNNLN